MASKFNTRHGRFGLAPGFLCLLASLSACAVPDRRATPAPAASKPAPRPSAQPAWVAREVVADGTAVAGGKLHSVKQGETGIAIANAYGVPWRSVANANNLAPPYLLRVGDKLLIPDAGTQRTPERTQAGQNVAGQSLEARARSFRLDIDDILTGGEPAEAASTARPAPDLAANAPAFRWPVEGRIISGFGPKPGGRFNDGVNLKVPAGTPVRAAADGTVAYAGDAIPGFGNLLLIRHAGGWVTAYGHNEELLVERGKAVKVGEVVARAGATGQVNEPQLHFEIRRGRTALDPQTLAR